MPDFTLLFSLFACRCRFCENFYLSVLMYYTIVLINHVLLLSKIFGIMLNKAGELYDKDCNMR